MFALFAFAFIFLKSFALSPKDTAWDREEFDDYFWSCFDTDEGVLDEYGDNCEYYTYNPGSCGFYDNYDWYTQTYIFHAATLCCACGGGQWNVECHTDADCPNGYICPTTPIAHHNDALGFYTRYCNKGVRTEFFETYGDCEVSGGTGGCYQDANCVSSTFYGRDNYRANEFCQVIITKPVDVTPGDTWEIECDTAYDGIYIDGGWNCQREWTPPKLYPGQKVEWYSDESYQMRGWQLCFTENTDMAVQETDLVKVVGDCELRDTCVSSANYPEPYEGFAYCTVEAKKHLSLTPTPGFEIEEGYSDHLVIGWGYPIYDESEVPEHLTKGWKIVWDTDAYTAFSGWEICFEEASEDIPDGWTCGAAYYANNDGCDCGCGVIDPDCLTTYNDVWGCDGYAGETCDETTALCVNTEGQTVPTWGWTCNSDYFGASDGCDCECGAVDPDCRANQDVIYNCNEGETCSLEHGNCLAADPLMMGEEESGDEEMGSCSGSGSWETSEYGECSNSCGGGYQVRDVVCSTGMAGDCTDVKPSEYQECNTDECVGPCAEFTDDEPGLNSFINGAGFEGTFACAQVMDYCDNIDQYCAYTCCLDANKIDLKLN